MEKHKVITNRAKKIKTKAHRWQVDSDGEIDFFAMSQIFAMARYVWIVMRLSVFIV